MTGSRSISREFLPTALLVGCVSLLFLEIIWSGKPLFGSDFLFYFFPLKKYIYDFVSASGSLPLWNMYQFSGTPLIGNIQAAMFYPLGFLFYLIPTEQAYGYTVMLHCALGAIFMYALLRSLLLTRPAAFTGAAIFSFNGFFMGHVYAGHLTFVYTYIWLPLIFQWVHRFIDSGRLKYAILAGLALGLQLLGGFPQIAFYTVLAIALFVVYHVAAMLKHGTIDSALSAPCGMVVILLSGLSLAAIQVYPTYEFAQLSSRSGGISYEFATIDSFDPLNFVTLVVPHFFGNPANNTYWKSTEVGQFWELGAYAGIGPLLLLGLLRKESKTRHLQRFLVIVLFFSLFLSLGKYNPVYPLVYFLPGFHHFRIPAQILYLYVFSLSILAAMGLDGATKLKSYSRWYKIILGFGVLFFAGLIAMLFFHPSLLFSFVFRVIQRPEFSPPLMAQLEDILKSSLFAGVAFFVLAAALIHLVFRHKQRYPWAMGALVLVMTADLATFSKSLIKTTDMNLDPQKKALLAVSHSDSEIHRVASMNGHRVPNDGLMYRYQDIQGYDPLILKRYLSYINRSQDTPQCSEAVNVGHVTNLNNHLIRMLNVKYVISSTTGLTTTQDRLPRAYIVHKTITVPSDRVLDYMVSNDFDPRQVVVLESPEHRQAFSLSPNAPVATGENGKPGRAIPVESEYCKIHAYENEEIQIAVAMSQNGYLVLSEISYPGWVAYVDGQKRQLLTGNYIFRVLSLTEGTHDVVIRYEPISFKIGLAVTLAAITLFAASTPMLAHKKKKSQCSFFSSRDP